MELKLQTLRFFVLSVVLLLNGGNAVKSVNQNSVNFEKDNTTRNILLIGVVVIVCVAIIAATFVMLNSNNSGNEVIVVNDTNSTDDAVDANSSDSSSSSSSNSKSSDRMTVNECIAVGLLILMVMVIVRIVATMFPMKIIM